MRVSCSFNLITAEPTKLGTISTKESFGSSQNKTFCPVLMLKVGKLSLKWFDTFFIEKNAQRNMFFDRFSVLCKGAGVVFSKKKLCPWVTSPKKF